MGDVYDNDRPDYFSKSTVENKFYTSEKYLEKLSVDRNTLGWLTDRKFVKSFTGPELDHMTSVGVRLMPSEEYNTQIDPYVLMSYMPAPSNNADQDPVNHPSHYNQFPDVEVIQITRHLNFDRGNAVKYICRAGYKYPDKELEDLEKALWYLTDEIKRVEFMAGWGNTKRMTEKGA